MRFKFDENLHEDGAELFRVAGHDVHTVMDEQLRGSDDRSIAEVCKAESRALISLDLDFANIREYPPAEYAGLVVLRLSRQSRMAVLRILTRVEKLLATERLAGRLWLVDEVQVRFRE